MNSGKEGATNFAVPLLKIQCVKSSGKVSV